MNIILELLLFLGIFFPLYHVFNVLFSLNRQKHIIETLDRPISILIPCYNEEKIITTTIEGLLRIKYNNFECIFINDGSNDKTLEQLKEKLMLETIKRKKQHYLNTKKIKQIYQSKCYPNLFVINKKNGGKSDALNVGINYAINDFIVTLDADSILKIDALALISTIFDDPNVVAGSGVIQILQSFTLSQTKDKTTLKIKPLLRLQTIEYIKSCFCYKASLAKLQSLLVISGAFGIFTKSILLAVNGFTNVIGEDLDLTLKIQFHIQDSNKKIVYVPEAICYTEGPETFRDFLKQRKRWQQSFLESIINFKKIIFKNIFTKVLPFFMIIDAMLIGIISSFIAIAFSFLIIDNIINHTLSYIFIYFCIFIFVHLIYNIVGLWLAHQHNITYKGLDFIRMILTIIGDLFIYRFIILYTIISGTISYSRDRKKWNKVNRSGRNYNILRKE